jgi:multidrug efflux pump subunit AcrA (membrane-fusion protein)
MWRVSALLLGTALFSALCVWWSRASDHVDEAPPIAPAEVAAVVETPPPPRIGRSPSSGGRLLPDAFVVTSCTVVPAQEQEVSSQLDGVFRELLVDVGQTVARGQVLGRLDDRQVRPQAELLEIKAASRSAELIAKAQHDEADWRVRYATKANESGLRSVSELESQTYRLQRERFAQEMRKACEDQEAARKELERARHLLALHEIRSGLDGVVVKVAKREGEAVKGQESLFRVADFRRLRIEGLCRVQQADLLRPGMRAAVEPEIPGEPIKELVGHTGAVTALAVSADGHWVVSASEDRTVALWGWPSAERRAVLPHPAEVYAVALIPIPEGTGLALLTGCADGRVRRWTVTEGGAVDGPTAWADGHEGAVRGLAVSPDGRWCATAGEDRRVGVWDLATGARQDWLQAARGTGTAHQGAATWVRFTPDGHLLSAGRDNQVRVWRQDGGAWVLAASHAGRTGEVTHLGVNPNGQRVLLDHGEELRIVGRDDGGFQGALGSRGSPTSRRAAGSSSRRAVTAASSCGRPRSRPSRPRPCVAVRRPGSDAPP